MYNLDEANKIGTHGDVNVAKIYQEMYFLP